MEQENNKLTFEKVEEFFKQIKTFLDQKYTHNFDIELRYKNVFVINDVQLIGYYEDISLCMSMTYDVGSNYIQFEIEHGADTYNHSLSTNLDIVAYIVDITDIYIEIYNIGKLRIHDIEKKYSGYVRNLNLNSIVESI